MDQKKDLPKRPSPPKHAQFKKGKSGNPRGRPRGARNLAGLLKEALEAHTGEGEERMTKLEAAVMQIADHAAAGDPRMLQMLLAELRRLEPKEAEHDCFDVIRAEMYAAELSWLANIRNMAAIPSGLEAYVERLRRAAEDPDPPPPPGVVWPQRPRPYDEEESA